MGRGIRLSYTRRSNVECRRLAAQAARGIPDRGDLEMGIHALFGVFETLNWIEHHELHKSDEELREVKDSLLLAGRLICEDFRRRF
jgi:hypothetical protein